MSRRVALLLAAASLVLAACGPETPVSFRMRDVSITVPRLITPAIELVEPAPTPPPLSLDPLPAIATFLPPPPLVVPTTTPPAATPAVEAPACPTADPLAAPAEPAALLVERGPASGRSEQRATTSFAGASTEPSAATIESTVDVVVAGLPTTTSAVGQRVDAWRVERSDPTAKSTSVEVYQLVHPSASPLATPAGIYLAAIVWEDPVRGALTFQPAGLGLHILPVPVQLSASGGAQYVGAATDPLTLTTLAIVRNVTGRKRVDVCGALVDTFTVEMTGTLTSPTSQRQVAWTQQLATAAGAAIVEDVLTLTSPADGFTWTRAQRNTSVPGAVR